MTTQTKRQLDDLRYNPIDLLQIEPSFGYLVNKNADFELVLTQIQSTLKDISKFFVNFDDNNILNDL